LGGRPEVDNLSTERGVGGGGDEKIPVCAGEVSEQSQSTKALLFTKKRGTREETKEVGDKTKT